MVIIIIFIYIYIYIYIFFFSVILFGQGDYKMLRVCWRVSRGVLSWGKWAVWPISQLV